MDYRLLCLFACALLLINTDLVKADVCPEGFKQAPNGGDCYQFNSYGGILAGTYDYCELLCSDPYGALLASIHSKEEQEFIANSCNQPRMVGLKCIGRDCKWDDGTPYDYTEYPNELPDDGEKRCLMIDINGEWVFNDCLAMYHVCWVCQLRVPKIACAKDEVAYGGGCISIHKEPQNVKTAEATCNGEGGHLVSTHGNDFSILDIAKGAGLTSSFFLGAEYVNRNYLWIDGSRMNTYSFPEGFPNTNYGFCLQMMLSDEWGVGGEWTNAECDSKLPFLCMRYADAPLPTGTVGPIGPYGETTCIGIDAYSDKGKFYSPNYPISITPGQFCAYILGVDEGKRVSLTFKSYNCESGTTLSLYDGLDSDEPFVTFDIAPASTLISYNTTTDMMLVTFETSAAPTGLGFEVEFHAV